MAKAHPDGYPGEPGRIAAILDPEVGFDAFSKRAMLDTPGTAANCALGILAWALTEKSLDFLVDHLQTGDRPQLDEGCLELMLHVKQNQTCVYPTESSDHIAKLRARALPELRAAATQPGAAPAAADLNEMIRQIAMGGEPAK